MRSHASDFALMYNKASPVFANNTNIVKLTKDSLLSDDFSAASQFQAQVSPAPGAIGSANRFELSGRIVLPR